MNMVRMSLTQASKVGTHLEQNVSPKPRKYNVEKLVLCKCNCFTKI